MQLFIALEIVVEGVVALRCIIGFFWVLSLCKYYEGGLPPEDLGVVQGGPDKVGVVLGGP